MLVVATRGRRLENFPASRLFFAEPNQISLVKFNDIVSLCDSLALPKDDHNLYHNLPHSRLVHDVLIEPDIDEDSDNDICLSLT